MSDEITAKSFAMLDLPGSQRLQNGRIHNHPIL